MSIYFFDFRDDGVLTSDDEGVDLPDLNAAKVEAAKALAAHAGEVIIGSKARELAIEVRHDDGPLFRTQINFEVENFKDGDD